MASPDAERDRRLADALRANLRRRKAQARAATEPQTDEPAEAADPPVRPSPPEP